MATRSGCVAPAFKRASTWSHNATLKGGATINCRNAVAAGPLLASPDDVARAVLFAITQPIELSISEIAVQPARRLAAPA